jgi:hypothetical protein
LPFETRALSLSLAGVSTWVQKLIMHVDLHWDLRPTGKRRPLLRGDVCTAAPATNISLSQTNEEREIPLISQFQN